MTKKILLTVALTGVLLAGCGNNANDTTEVETEVTTEVEVETEAVTEETEKTTETEKDDAEVSEDLKLNNEKRMPSILFFD